MRAAGSAGLCEWHWVNTVSTLDFQRLYESCEAFLFFLLLFVLVSYQTLDSKISVLMEIHKVITKNLP